MNNRLLYLELIQDLRSYLTQEFPPYHGLYFQSLCAVENKKSEKTTARLAAAPAHFPSSKPSPSQPKSAPNKTQEQLAPPSPPATPPPERALKENRALFDELKELFHKIAPELSIYPSPPSDQLAKERAAAWKKPPIKGSVVILCCGERGAERVFLENIAKAIDIRLLPAELVDALELQKEQRLDALLLSPSVKWIFTTHQTLTRAEGLKTAYREIPGAKKRFLGSIPLFVIPPPSFYFKNSQAKRALWEMFIQWLT